MNAIGENLPFLLDGFVLTLGYAGGALVIAMFLGGVLGTADYAVHYRPVRWAIRAFVGLFRNTPFIVQLYIWFFGLPYVGVQFSPAAASLLSLGLYGSSYVTEIVRAALVGVGTEQEEAALSVGLDHRDVTMRIVWPQPPVSSMRLQASSTTRSRTARNLSDWKLGSFFFLAA